MGEDSRFDGIFHLCFLILCELQEHDAIQSIMIMWSMWCSHSELFWEEKLSPKFRLS